MRKTDEQLNEERIERLARGFAAVVQAEFADLKSIDAVRKKHASRPVGGLWLSLARLVIEALKSGASGGVGPEHLGH